MTTRAVSIDPPRRPSPAQREAQPRFEPLRILQLYPKADYFTGAAMQLQGLAEGLARRGHHVIVATRPSPAWTARCVETALAHVALPMRSALDWRSVAGLARLLRRERIEVVHCHKGRARTAALLAGLLVDIPVLVLNRGVSFPLGRLSRWSYASRRVAGIVAVSRSIKEGLAAQGIPGGKIEVIYSGTATDRFHPGVDREGIRKELGLDRAHFLVTQIGVRSTKGNDDVLDAVGRVIVKAPQIRLLAVGARRPDGLLDLARARGLAGVVHVLGYREDIPEILAGSDCCVDASHTGLGLTGALREALAVETPVVATAVEGNPELVVDGETGLLVPARSPETLASALLRVIGDPDGARAMARAGRQAVEAGFSMRVKVERMEAFYRRLLSRRRGPAAAAAAPPAPAMTGGVLPSGSAAMSRPRA